MKLLVFNVDQRAHPYLANAEEPSGAICECFDGVCRLIVVYMNYLKPFYKERGRIREYI
jgi:hypothetical protein